MARPAARGWGEGVIDCRTCKNYSERSGGCMSVVVCVSGRRYRDTAAVQLFDGPAPALVPVAWVPIHPTLGPLWGHADENKTRADSMTKLPLSEVYLRPVDSA